MDYYRIFLEPLLDLVFPKRCVVCASPGHPRFKKYLCASCFTRIPLQRRQECIGCRAISPRGITCSFCTPEHAVDRLIVTAPYSTPELQRLLKALKYQFVADCIAPISALALKRVKKLAGTSATPFDPRPIVVPVPLHQRRLNWRGFNQSTLIAQALAQHFLLTCDETVLTRTKHTTPQVEHSTRDERLALSEDTFLCPAPDAVQGAHVLLVDDVCTTGATLNACARTLKRSGAGFVTAFVVARGG